MKTSTIVIIVVALFGLLLLGASLLGGGSFIANENSIKAPSEDPIDVSSDLANRWLGNLNATTSLSLAEFVAAETSMTDTLKARLSNQDQTELDPILCQTTVPGRIGAKLIFVTADAAQTAVLARGADKTPNQAIMTMAVQDDQWIVNDISCSAGETGGPVGEYDFEQVGRLVSTSVPAPYNADDWHLIFNDQTDTVQVVTLLFDESSSCLNEAGETVCDPTQLTEGAASFVQANMTEAGAQVKRLDVQ